jgi:hypothetical protein
MGLFASIYRSGFNSPNNLLGGWKEVTIVNVDGPFDPSPDRPAVRLAMKGYGDPIVMPDIDYLHQLGSFTRVPDDDHVMMGGAFVWTSDQRFAQAIRDLTNRDGGYFAVPLHDLSRSLEFNREVMADADRISWEMDEPQTEPEHV